MSVFTWQTCVYRVNKIFFSEIIAVIKECDYAEPGHSGGALLDRIHHLHRQSSVPERSDKGCVTQHRPLLGLGVPPQSQACSAFALPREVYIFTYQAPSAPGQGRPHVCQTPGIHPQAPPRQEGHRRSWITPETWSMIETRTVTRLQGDQHNARALARATKTELQGDRRRTTAEAGSAVEALLASYPPLIREAWIRI